ncbi:MAG: hypothetical protein HZB51_29630 [Chloroflexi bacterium]|nr:hypothetical protein [Chloroflexota bacterium]
MSNLRWKNKIRESVRELQLEDIMQRPDVFFGKFLISICAGFVTSVIAMLVVNEISWLFVVPLSIAALLVFGATQK